MTDQADILSRILATKAEEIAQRKTDRPIALLTDIAAQNEAPRGFAKALLDKANRQQPAVIAEIKKASPSKGVLREDFQPLNIAQDYAMHGATCLSILTDKNYFQGAEVYLQMVRERCPLPVLRKDFMIDPYQIYESHALGADCILLIVAALSDESMHQLAELAAKLGMDVLVEVHDENELERALQLNTPLIGVNNRNLRTFTTDLATCIRLKQQLPADRLLVAESGIHSATDIAHLQQQGIYSYLIGEAFMRAPSPGAQLQAMFAPA
ncbi:MAG: indole-3-glycerol phosphate synthase TrpC [Methylococcales bacterium]|nr:indole-3-glycerol phosphate synthase TrpC [Methylococcales bacterium]